MGVSNPRTGSPRPHPQPCISTHRLALSTLCWCVRSNQRVLVLVAVYGCARVLRWSLRWPPRGVAAALKSPFGWPPFAPLLVVPVRVANLLSFRWPPLGEPLCSGIPNRLASFHVIAAGAWCSGKSVLMMVLGVKGRLRWHTKHQGLRLHYEGNPTVSFSFGRHLFSSLVAAYRPQLAVAASASGGCFPYLRYVSAPGALTSASYAAPLHLYLPVVYTTANVCVHLAIRLYWCLQKYALRVYRCKPSRVVAASAPP